MNARLLTATLILIAAPVGAITLEADLGPSSPTSMGQAIIGFQPGFLPFVQPGDLIGDLEVKKTVEQGHFIVVYADDLRDVRAATLGLPGIAYIEDDVVKYSLAVPNDSRYNEQYGPEQLGAHDAWDDVGYGSSDIIVAVLDTGIRRTHQDFESGRILQGHDYVNNDNNPNDDCTHGTHVSGTVAATTNNGIGVAGVSQATIMPMKVLGPIGGIFSVTCSGSASDIADAIYDATDDGAHIISMSLGGGGSSTEENAVVYAWNNGVLVVAANGNDGGSNSIDCPACYDEVIAVAALTSNKVRASYSDAGAQSEISAAGSDVLSTSDSSNSAYQEMDGTSMATPHVAGALALALSCAPNTSNSAMRTLMQNTAEDLGANGRDTIYGFGLIRVDLMVNQLSCGTGGGGNTAPNAAFGFSTNNLAADFDASASNDPDGSISSYSWTFGDGATGSGISPSHTYAAGGSYSVTLTVTDNDGATDSETKTVTVSSSGGGGGGTGYSIDFESGSGGWTQTSNGGSASWALTTARSSSPSTSVAIRNYGTNENDVLYSPIIDLSGLADATLSLDSWMQGEEYCFFSCTIYDYGGIAISDDGGSSWRTLLGNYFESSGWDTLTYNIDAEAGSSQVQLRFNFVSDDTTQNEGWYIDDVEITGTPSGGGGNQAPTASFTESCTDLACSFDASGSSDPDGSISSYSWDFGDGATGSGVSPSHTYGGSGTYSVSLTVTDNDGASSSTSHSVTVTAANQGPTASFTESCTDLGCSFDGSGSSDPDGSISSYSWTFGDGASGSDASPSHTYGSAGTYTVTLTVTDNDGASDSTSHSVTVTAPPTGGCTGGEAVTEMDSGVTYEASLSSGQWAYGKVCIEAGTSVLDVVMSGPACGLFSCSIDGDLYVRQGALPTTSSYDCRPYTTGNDESCSHSNPTSGWWYIGMYAYSGSGTLEVTATY
ncbi:MAG: PKD domain-containing protein [Thermoplasmatota archaeon]